MFQRLNQLLSSLRELTSTTLGCFFNLVVFAAIATLFSVFLPWGDIPTLVAPPASEAAATTSPLFETPLATVPPERQSAARRRLNELRAAGRKERQKAVPKASRERSALLEQLDEVEQVAQHVEMEHKRWQGRIQQLKEGTLLLAGAYADDYRATRDNIAQVNVTDLLDAVRRDLADAGQLIKKYEDEASPEIPYQVLNPSADVRAIARTVKGLPQVAVYNERNKRLPLLRAFSKLLEHAHNDLDAYISWTSAAPAEDDSKPPSANDAPRTSAQDVTDTWMQQQPLPSEQRVVELQRAIARDFTENEDWSFLRTFLLHRVAWMVGDAGVDGQLDHTKDPSKDWQAMLMTYASYTGQKDVWKSPRNASRRPQYPDEAFVRLWFKLRAIYAYFPEYIEKNPPRNAQRNLSSYSDWLRKSLRRFHAATREDHYRALIRRVHREMNEEALQAYPELLQLRPIQRSPPDVDQNSTTQTSASSSESSLQATDRRPADPASSSEVKPRTNPARERLLARARNPAVRNNYQPFLAPGRYVFGESKSAMRRSIKQTPSFANIEKSGALKDGLAFALAGAGVTTNHGHTWQYNDRPKWPTPGSYDGKPYEPLLKEFKELAPYWIELGYLRK